MNNENEKQDIQPPIMPDIPSTGDIEDYQYFRKCHERKYYPED